MPAPHMPKHNVTPLSIVGWVLGATSVLNLVNDIGKVAVFGKVKAWLDAYSSFVILVGKFLFGWIEFSWISVSPSEYHVLVLQSVLCAAFFRAQRSIEAQKKIRNSEAIENAFFSALTAFLLAFVPILLFSGVWGVVTGVIGVALSAWVLLLHTPVAGLASGVVVRRELLGMFGVFVVLVAVNFSFSRLDGG